MLSLVLEYDHSDDLHERSSELELGERIGASAERSSEDEAQIRTIFDAIPARELQNQISSWNTAGVIYMNSK